MLYLTFNVIKAIWHNLILKILTRLNVNFFNLVYFYLVI